MKLVVVIFFKHVKVHLLVVLFNSVNLNDDSLMAIRQIPQKQKQQNYNSTPTDFGEKKTLFNEFANS